MAFTNYIQKITDTGGTTHDLLDSSASHFIRGTQTASTNVWTGPLPDGVSDYYDGLMIDYWLPFAGTSTAATLNLGGKGAKPVYRGNAATSGVTTHIAAKTVAHLIYIVDSGINSGNGAWIMSSYYDSDSNTVDRLRDSYFRPYAGEAVYRYKFVMQGADNRMYPITLTNQENATQVAKVPTQVGLRPGRIWYYNTTATVAAGGLFAANSLDEAFQTTAGAYNFNTSAATYRMIYLRGTYNKTTDLFTLYKDSSSPCTSYYTYVPTNTANITLSSYFTSGYYYMLLGGTYSTADYISLFPYNPLYYFDGTNLIPVSTKVAQDTNTTYSAGTGISLSGTTFSAKLGYTTSGNNRAVQADSNGNLYVTQKDDNSNTTYTLANALASHKFTWTLTPSSGSATTTTAELAAGTGITLTDYTTNKKITIACSVTNTDEKVKLTSQSTSGTYPLIFGPTSITSDSTYQGYYNTGITVNPSTKTVTATTFVGALTGTASGNLTSSSTLDATKLSGTIPTSCYTNTKNTAGTTNKTGTKMFLVAATEQSANPTTYSNSNCYIGTDNCLYSGGSKVLTSHQTAVTSLTTTAGTHVTKTSATGAVSMTIPTKTSHLTNDSGFISTAAQIIRW